jgi:hypothetical protein
MGTQSFFPIFFRLIPINNIYIGNQRRKSNIYTKKSPHIPPDVGNCQYIDEVYSWVMNKLILITQHCTLTVK